jgi:hypothetical protein
VDTLARRLAGANPGAETPIPECAIRARCRWFGQVGVEACRFCSLVVTEASDKVVDGL